MQQGDVIVSIAGRPTYTTAQLQEVIAGLSPGDNAEVIFYRDGKKMSTTVTMRNNRGDVSITRPDGDLGLGASFAALDESTARNLEIRGGVAVSDIDHDGRFGRAGCARKLHNPRCERQQNHRTRTAQINLQAACQLGGSAGQSIVPLRPLPLGQSRILRSAPL